MRMNGALALSLFLMAAAVSAPSQASSCSAACAKDLLCTGGCSVDTPSCGAACTYTGCSATCKEIGPKILECNNVDNVSCPRDSGGPPPASTEGQALGQWAIIGRPVFLLDEYAPEHMPVIAFSSREFARQSAARMAEKLNAEQARRRGLEGREQERDVLGSPVAPQPELFVGGGAGRCVEGQRVSLVDKRFPVAPGRKVSAYVKGTTDGTGRAVSLEILYTRNPEWSHALVGYGVKNLRVESPQSAGRALEFYGALFVDREGRAGYVIGGVFVAFDDAQPDRPAESG